jgi:predicted metal-binding protein
MKQSLRRYIEVAKKMGAVGAKLISSRSIVTAHWVRMKCQYGCSGYGDRLTCPPYSPTPEQTAKIVREYKTALLIHGDGHTSVTKIAAKLEREVFLDGHYKAFAMGSGPCRLCNECNKKECSHSENARPSMEACGIDVYLTARRNGFPIRVVTDHAAEQNYYAVVLIE